MRRFVLLLTLVIPACGPTPMPGPARIDPATAPAELAAAINAERAMAGLPQHGNRPFINFPLYTEILGSPWVSWT